LRLADPHGEAHFFAAGPLGKEATMEDEVVLRRYRPTDLQAIFEMDVICFSEPFRFDRRSMRRFSESSKAIAVVAERVTEDRSSGSLAGFVIVHTERTHRGRRGYVVTLDVSPAQRREGVAGRLMTEAEALARGAGVGRMELDVYVGNDGAIRFYEGRGYERLGVRPGFYGTVGGTSLDAYTYTKELKEM